MGTGGGAEMGMGRGGWGWVEEGRGSIEKGRGWVIRKSRRGWEQERSKAYGSTKNGERNVQARKRFHGRSRMDL